TFQGKSTFGARLKKITVNLSINSHNKRSEYLNVSYEDEFRHELDENDGIDVTGEEANSKVQKIMKALNSLKESYRIVLTLHLIEGYDYDEICEILGLCSANCRTSISRAKESLRKKLTEYGYQYTRRLF